jgi:hypothetical protein
VKCEECDREISSDATSCPGCGKKPKKPVGLGGYIVGGLVLIIIFNIASRDEPKPVAQIALTPGEQATKAKDDSNSNARLLNTVSTLRTVKAALRDPKSVEWIDTMANEDGSVVCVTYRARNGFGGLNVERATMVAKTISQSSVAWEQNCAGRQLYNVKRAQPEVG